MFQIDKIKYLQIGVQGENVATDIEIDMSTWAEKYPNAVFHILFKPYNATAPSPMESTYEDGVLTWTVGVGATAVVGVGYTEIRAQDAETGLIKKTRIIPTSVDNSVSGVETTPPASYQEWVTAVLNAGTDAKNSAAAAMAYSQGKQIKFEIGDDDDPDGMAGHLLFYFKDEDDEDWEDYLDCGPVDVYAMAVATGYTGTKAQWVQSMNDAESNAQKAEKYAVGKVNGTDVGSTDPTYHNNSKYYSEQAADSATAAAAAQAAAESAAQTDLVAWLEENITNPDSPPLDRTLSSSSSATPADITGDLKSAMNTESLFLQDAIGDATGKKPIARILGKVVNVGISTGIDVTDLVDRAGFACSVVSCSQGDTFIITASGYGNYRSYAFVKSDGTRLEASGSGVNLTNEIKIAPANTAYLVINDSSNSASFYGKLLNEDEVKAIMNQPSENLFDPLSEQIIEGKSIYTGGSEIGSTDYIISGYMPVAASTRYYLLNCLSTSDNRMAAVYDESLNILATKAFASDQYIDTPANARWMRISVTKTRRYTAQVKLINSATYIPYRDKRYARTNMIAPDYVPGGTYTKDSVVTEAGYVYKANQNNTDSSFTEGNWDRLGTVLDLIQGSASVADDNKAVKFADNAFSTAGTSLSANTAVELGYANIAKNVIYELCCKFTSPFGSITIGKGDVGTKYASWVVIDATKVTTYLELGSSVGSSSLRTSEFNFPEGFTIQDFINVRIETTDDYTCYVEIQTNNEDPTKTTYRTPTTGRFYGNSWNKYYFEATFALTEYDFTVIHRDAMKPVWLFGDSYMSFTDDRWVYYLKDLNQFNNVLINALAGITSARASYALGSLKGKPKFALWTLGMNDSSDTDEDTPSETWINNVNNFLLWCKSHDCTPIFGTIPTTPDYESGGVTKAGKYNEGKNKWIRNSGYRYIDFAKAYGADAEGNWYPGMLTEGDWVHPTAIGAKAAFHRALADFPEIMGAL